MYAHFAAIVGDCKAFLDGIKGQHFDIASQLQRVAMNELSLRGCKI